jgi:ribonucleoside-diphosphate reductase alpha chain
MVTPAVAAVMELEKPRAIEVVPQDIEMDYHALNAMLNLYGPNGEVQFDKDVMAVRQYFLDHVNQNTVFFHNLDEKLEYLVEEGYYEKEVLDQYSRDFIHELFDRAYKAKFRFKTFLGAFKYYTSYTLKTFDGKRYLERYEDRVVMVAFLLARGNEELARHIVDEVITGRFSMLGKNNAANWFPASCFASKTTWNPSDVPLTLRCNCPSAAAVLRSH